MLISSNLIPSYNCLFCNKQMIGDVCQIDAFQFYNWRCDCKFDLSISAAKTSVRLLYRIDNIKYLYNINASLFNKYLFTTGEFDFMSGRFFPFPKSLKEILHYKKLRMLE